MKKLIALILIILASNLASHQSYGQSDPGNQNGNLVCNISGLMPLSGNETITAGKKLSSDAMASCHTDQGFSSDIPIKVEITSAIKDSPSRQVNIKAIVQPFAVPREQTQMFDRYVMLMAGPRSTPANTASGTLAAASGPVRSVIMKGQRSGLLIEVLLSGDDKDMQNLSLKEMRLSYDDKSPTLKR